MYSGMTKDSLEWQKKIRKFVDTELIPWEIYAEKNEGNIPSEIEKKHQLDKYSTYLEFAKKVHDTKKKSLEMINQIKLELIK